MNDVLVADEFARAGDAGDAEAVRAVFEAMPTLMVAVEGPDHVLVAGNRLYRAFAGRSAFLGRPAREAFPDIAGQQLFELLDQVYASGEPVEAREWRLQMRPQPDEAPVEVYVDFSLTPWLFDDGTVRGILITQSDVTERVQQRHGEEERTAAAERRYRVARDVVVELQQTLLPPALPVLPTLDIAGRYLVAAHDQAAGGDWFDVVTLPDGTVALIVGDVVGHGVAASAAMGQLRAVVAELLLETGDAAEALARADRMATRVPALRATTVVLAVLDPLDGSLRYSTCGHVPPLVVDVDGTTRVLAGSAGGPLGTGTAARFVKDHLAPGQTLVLYSDGLVERPGEPLSTGIDRLATVAGDAAANRALQQSAPGSLAERLCRQSMELLTRGGYGDDVTILATQVRPTPIQPFGGEQSATITGFTSLRDDLDRWLETLGLPRSEVRRIELAAGELMANAIDHAYTAGDTFKDLSSDRSARSEWEPGPVRLHAALEADGSLQVVVSDDGTWSAPTAPADTRGRGLWMAGSAVDELRLDTDHDGGTTATMRHRLQHPADLVSSPGGSPETSGRSDVMKFVADFDEGPPRVLRVSGFVDFSTASQLADRIDIASRGGVHPLVLDLSDVEVLGSAGVSVLFTARDQHAIHGHELTIHTTPGGVPAQILDLVGLRHAPPPSGATPHGA